MANHKSALKRIRQTVKRRARNRHILTTMRTHLKRVRAAIDAGDVDAATSALAPATQALAKAASKGVIHRKQASRKISRLTIAVRKLSA
ncbi:MAG: 30S ribosomal protein S20 [Myxococcota bacterium]|nr:30S ribosomal protein S20 [Myxococcota bacterium]